MKQSDTIWIKYTFHFEKIEKEDFVFTVLLDRKSNIALAPEGCREHEWTKLDFYKCHFCTLDPEKHPNCPIAYNISGLAEAFCNMYSTEKVKMIVEVPQRTYTKTDTAQQGLRSILGIYLAASGCPHMSILKPMTKFHLPFASMEETIYRHVGNYLIKQYFEYRDGKKPDIDLDGLMKKNAIVNEVNKGICKRIDSISEADANKNALVILNAISLMLELELKTNLDSLKSLFVDA